MPNKTGFTLVELVIVIVILGILAVIAAPKFLNIQADARLAALKGLKAGIEGANTNIYGKSAIEGKLNQAGANVKYNGKDLGLEFGYLAATPETFNNVISGGFSERFEQPIGNVKAKPGDEWVAFDMGKEAGQPRVLHIWQNNAPMGCFLTYIEATANSAPKYTLPKSSNC